jgi:hypothetical protein
VQAYCEPTSSLFKLFFSFDFFKLGLSLIFKKYYIFGYDLIYY